MPRHRLTSGITGITARFHLSVAVLHRDLLHQAFIHLHSPPHCEHQSVPVYPIRAVCDRGGLSPPPSYAFGCSSSAFFYATFGAT